MYDSNESVSAIAEQVLVKRLLSDVHWQDRFLRIHGIPEDPLVLLEVPLEGLGARGDIDILALTKDAPHESVAIQIKRIKVSARTFETGLPNRLAAISELLRQSNLLVELGFWKVFSYAIVVVDSRANNRGEYKFDGLTPELRLQVDNGMSLQGLHPKAGFIQFEVCQPIDQRPLSTGTFSSRIHRMPTSQSQSAALTCWVKSCAQK